MKLRDYPFDIVRFSCGKCLRSGRYKKQSLIEKYGEDTPCPDLRAVIAHDCERMKKGSIGTDPCAISYPDLLKSYLDSRKVTD